MSELAVIPAPGSEKAGYHGWSPSCAHCGPGTRVTPWPRGNALENSRDPMRTQAEVVLGPRPQPCQDMGMHTCASSGISRTAVHYIWTLTPWGHYPWKGFPPSACRVHHRLPRALLPARPTEKPSVSLMPLETGGLHQAHPYRHVPPPPWLPPSTCVPRGPLPHPTSLRAQGNGECRGRVAWEHSAPRTGTGSGT